jgi:hypothetical protein
MLTTRRPEWDELPDGVRDAIELRLGARVVAAASQNYGFSPGLAARLSMSDGRRAFVKGVSLARNAQSFRLQQHEIDVMTRIDASISESDAPVPRMIAAIEHDDWLVLALADIAGHSPRTPWSDDQLTATLTALSGAHSSLVATPRLPDASDLLAPAMRGWRRIAAGVTGVPDDLPVWARKRIDKLATMEESWALPVTGETVLHTDLRSDNILIAERTWIVDWAHACQGPAWLDHVLMAPSVAASGGPPPEALVPMKAVDEEALTAVVVALTGYFVEQGSLPAPPGMPRARDSQRAQGRTALEWLRRLLARERP